VQGGVVRGWNRLFAKVLIYAVLEVGAMLGVPMRPDDIEKMTRQMNNAVTEAVRREEDPSGDPPDAAR
jgi:hypothetical protein